MVPKNYSKLIKLICNMNGTSIHRIPDVTKQIKNTISFIHSNNCIKDSNNIFYSNVLKSPKYIVAPMVDQSELAFRMLCREFGAHLCYTPMLHSRLFVQNEKYRKKMFTTCPEDRPLIVQFCGNDPEIILQAAKMVENACDGIDINLGCPQAIARKGNYGSFLMKDEKRVYDIVSLLNKELNIPVTCKIRIFDDNKKTIQFCKMLQEAGCQLLTIHGRTKEMNKQLIGPVNWSIIKDIKKILNMPVIANGGIENYQDVERCLKETNADGVMSSEAILVNPAIFDNTIQMTPIEITCKYLMYAKKYNASDIKIIKAHLFKFLFQELKKYTDIRDKLSAAGLFSDFEQVVSLLKDAIHIENEPFVYTMESSWYRRHRKKLNE